LCRRLAQTADVVGVSRHAPSRDLAGRHVICDLLDPRRTRDVVHEIQPALVIHAQAMSDVDRCEREPKEAQAYNVQATKHLVDALPRSGDHCWLFSVSTDYVFDGTKGRSYVEDDVSNPISVYGRTKLEGERVALDYARSIILRPSTLYGPDRMNYCNHVADQLQAGQGVEAFVDQTTSPTYTEDVAEAIADLSDVIVPHETRGADTPRIMHLSNTGACTRLAFAHRIADLLGQPRELIRPIRMAEQQRSAPRPAYSALAGTALARTIGRTMRPWEEALQTYLGVRHPSMR